MVISCLSVDCYICLNVLRKSVRSTILLHGFACRVCYDFTGLVDGFACRVCNDFTGLVRIEYYYQTRNILFP